MQIFEFHFNPKIKDDYFFDSFVYEPENIYEKKLGNLYMAGDIKNALPQNQKLLENLAQTIKKSYYNLSLKSAGKSLAEGLKKSNEFLSEEVKKENVSWMGNLNFAILSIKDLDLAFTKTGDIKILLIRSGQIVDVGENLNLKEVEPHPLKVFFNIVSGKLAQNDIILVLTKEIFEFFHHNGLLDKIAQIEKVNKKSLGEAIPSRLFTKDSNFKTSGICFLAVLQESEDSKNLIQKPDKHKKEVLSHKKEIPPLNRLLSPLSKPSKIIRAGSHKLNLLKKSGQSPKSQERNKPPKKDSKIKLPGSFLAGSSIKIQSIKKKLILLSILIVLLTLGFLIFKEVGQRKERKAELPKLEEIEEKYNQAERYLIFKEEEKANSLLKEAWLEITTLIEEKESSEALSLKQSIEESLVNLNKIEKIEDPKLLIDLGLKETGFNPKNILLLNSDLYFYSPSSPNICKVNLETNEKVILKSGGDIKFADTSDNSAMFFSQPNTLFSLKDGNWHKTAIDSSGYNFSSFLAYASSLYFWDEGTKGIIKYPYLLNFKWESPQVWIKEKAPEEIEAKSMTSDGSIWVLDKNHSVHRFYKGAYQNSIAFNVFPSLENVTKIETKMNLPYLYFLEPINKRVIITDKNGRVVKQFQSDKFNKLKDLIISDDGRIIYLLNDEKVYKIEM